MANTQRGELKVVLGGVEYACRPTFESIARIEERANVGIMELATRVLNVKFKITDAAIMIEEFIKGAGDTPPKNIGKLVMEAGASKLSDFLARSVVAAISGDEEPEKGEAGAVAS